MKIAIQPPGGEELEIELREFPAVIGRAEECSILLADPKVSRRHAVIERRGNDYSIVDLDSANGVSLNGERTSEGPLRPGDEVRAGDTRLRILAGSSAPAEAERSAPAAPLAIPRARRRRVLAVLGPAFLLLLILGGAARLIFFGPEAPPAVDPGPARRAAERDLDELMLAAGLAPAVTPELLARAAALAEKHRGVEFPYGFNPVVDFHSTLRSRRDLELGNRLFEISARRLELLEEKRYGEAIDYLREAQRTLRGEAPAAQETVRKLLDGAEEAAAQAFALLERELAYLEDPAFGEDCLALYRRGLESFAGTPQARTLSVRLAAFQERLARAAGERQRAEDLARRLQADRAREQAEAAPAPEAGGLAALLRAPIRAGALREKSYRFGDLEGTPREVRDDGGVVLATAGGERTIPFDEIPADIQLLMARDGLSGDALLEAASIGYRRGLDALSGRLLAAFLQEPGVQRRERQEKIDGLLAEARGLDRVPEGGFTWSPAHGWEDALQRTARESVEEADRLAARIAAGTAASTEKDMERIGILVEDQRLPAESRAVIRKRALEALGALRVRLARELSERIKRSGFQHLLTARRELERRREAALRAIYDAALYLPESHPDWSKGDRVNGQEAVDALVGSVRELWESAGRYAVTVDASTRRQVERMRSIEEVWYPRLLHRPEPIEEDYIEELMNNLDQAIDLRTFARDRADLELYRYNRRVAAYNRALNDPAVSEQDKAHVGCLNDYREMLGRRRLFIDPRLCRATRKHSAACSAAGRIWHSGPDGTPQSRARAEGFPGSVAENVAIGYATPKDIWINGWYRASDHHRIALGAQWNCMGYGYDGSVGTQNFSTITAPFNG